MEGTARRRALLRVMLDPCTPESQEGESVLVGTLERERVILNVRISPARIALRLTRDANAWDSAMAGVGGG